MLKLHSSPVHYHKSESVKNIHYLDLHTLPPGLDDLIRVLFMWNIKLNDNILKYATVGHKLGLNFHSFYADQTIRD